MGVNKQKTKSSIQQLQNSNRQRFTKTYIYGKIGHAGNRKMKECYRTFGS